MCKDSHPCRLKNPTLGNLNGYYNVGASCKTQHLSGFCFGYYPCISHILFLSQCGSSVHVDHLKMSMQR